MKKLLLILLCLPIIGFGQLTYIPDDNFEQALINLGYDNVLDDYVTTSNINTITYLDVSFENISDLTGIEEFNALTELLIGYNQLTSLNISNNTSLIALQCGGNQLTALDVSNNINLLWISCHENQLTSLDVSANTSLIGLECRSNQLTSLDVSGANDLTDLVCYSNNIINLDISQNITLTELYCNHNQLTNIDVSMNTFLTHLQCNDNQIANLDVSNNTNLEKLWCYNNQLISLNVSMTIFLTALDCRSNLLTSLDLRNGNNTNTYFVGSDNPNLYCIDVDDVAWSTVNWTASATSPSIDLQHYFSNNCIGATSLQEHTKNKELLKITDLLGKETKGTKNEVLFYIYDDGTVEKRIVIE